MDELKNAVEIIKDRLYFAVCTRLPLDTPRIHCFTIDDTLRYEPFFGDFGPLNLSCTYRFCEMLKTKLTSKEYENKVIYFYCCARPQQKSNAAVLIGVYQVLYLGLTPQQAYEPLKALGNGRTKIPMDAHKPYMPFRDASQGVCTFRLSVLHCLRAMCKAAKYHFFDFNTFNAQEYEHFECVENGDLNIIVPGKLLAFSGPHGTNMGMDGLPLLTPSDYIPIFQMYNVSTVIRLNKKCYDRKDFTSAGIHHYDLFFVDGSTPSTAIVDKFLNIVENHSGTIAVHCKAGLGRTGTTIGCYIMKHYRFTAAECIAWIRICRPGSVIGPQQHYLKMQEARMWKLGKQLRTSRKEEIQNTNPNATDTLPSAPNTQTNPKAGQAKQIITATATTTTQKAHDEQKDHATPSSSSSSSSSTVSTHTSSITSASAAVSPLPANESLPKSSLGSLKPLASTSSSSSSSGSSSSLSASRRHSLNALPNGKHSKTVAVDVTSVDELKHTLATTSISNSKSTVTTNAAASSVVLFKQPMVVRPVAAGTNTGTGTGSGGAVTKFAFQPAVTRVGITNSASRGVTTTSLPVATRTTLHSLNPTTAAASFPAPLTNSTQLAATVYGSAFASSSSSASSSRSNSSLSHSKRPTTGSVSANGLSKSKIKSVTTTATAGSHSAPTTTTNGAALAKIKA